MRRLTDILTAVAFIMLYPGVEAQMLPDSTFTDDSFELRLEGVTDYGGEDPVCIPSFIRQTDIEMNGSQWPVWDTENKAHRTFSILHIGDSHLQADIATDAVRTQLQFDFGNAGRGLITPLRLGGTNEPSNYIFRSDIRWNAEKFMKPTRNDILGFTGCALTADAPAGYIEVGTNDKQDWNPFSTVTLYVSGDPDITGVTDVDGSPIQFETESCDEGNGIRIRLFRPVTTARISILSLRRVRLYGAFLSADRPGLYYNVIGHNGATYYNYNNINDFSEGIACLRPDLVILSLGTNEAFGGNFSATALKSQIIKLIDSILENSPSANLLLVTPQECHRRLRTYRRRGKRRKTAVSSTFTVNTNVARAREAIMTLGRDRGIPVYDFYEVAGGAGSADKWVKNGLFSKDHIHLSGAGYRLQGKLLHDALISSLTSGQ